MKLKTLLTVSILASVAQASVQNLLPNLTSEDLNVQTQARLELLALCAEATAPGIDEAKRKALSEEMCRVLQTDIEVEEVLRPLIRNLQRIGGAEAVPALTKLMGHPNEHVRDDARRALAVNPSEEAAQALGVQLKMRKARSPKDTAGLIQALGQRRTTGAEKLIAVHLDSADDQIYIATVKALGRIGSPAAIRALAPQRSSQNGLRLVQVDAALFSTDHADVFQRLYAESEPDGVRAVALLVLIRNNGLEVAASAMATGEPALQTAVIEAAAQTGDPKLYSLLAASLDTLPPGLQVQAMGALEFSGIVTYAQVIEPFLTDGREAKVQDAAAQALARIGTAKSVAPLLASGTQKSRRALGMLNAAGVGSMLEEEAAASKDPNRRAMAIDVLARRGRRDLIPTFFEYAAGEPEPVAKAAAKAIGEIGDTSNLEACVQLMVARESDRVSRDILKATVAILRRSPDQAKAVEILEGRMDSASPRSQANILQALAQTGSTETLKPLADATRSSDENLRKTAAKVLGGWKGTNGIPVMLELAADESTSMANHVTLMRGVSRLLAGQRRLNKTLAEQALQVCRREEERAAIQATLDKDKK